MLRKNFKTIPNFLLLKYKMTSVLRYMSQPASATIWNVGGAYLVKYDDIMTWASEQNAVVNGNVILLNMNDDDFSDAVGVDLFEYYYRSTTEYTSFIDLGKKIYIGMTNNSPSEFAGESRMVILSHVKVLQNDYDDSGIVGYIITGANINDTIYNKNSSYFNIYVGRGAA